MNFLPLALWAMFFPVCADISAFLNYKMQRDFKQNTQKFLAGFYLAGIIAFTILGFITIP